MNDSERKARLERYASGPALLRAALAKVPEEALQWRPEPGKWSAHEVVCHCADSETVASTRIRYVVGEDQPTIQGYDENRWATAFNYHALALEEALLQVEQVRAWTLTFLRTLPASAWLREATHTESGRYKAETWLVNYSEHLEIHARQIERNLKAWRARTAS